MSSQGSINVAFILSLIGGIVIVLSGFVSFFGLHRKAGGME